MDMLEPQPKKGRRSSKSNPDTDMNNADREREEIPIFVEKNSLAATEVELGKKDRRQTVPKQRRSGANEDQFQTNSGNGMQGPGTKADTSDRETKYHEVQLLKMTESQQSADITNKLSQVSPDRDRESSLREGPFAHDSKKVGFASTPTDMAAKTGTMTSPQNFFQKDNEGSPKSSRKNQEDDKMFQEKRPSGKLSDDSDAG